MSAETIVILLFLLSLCLCIISGASILIALLFGFVCLFIYAMHRGNSFKETLRMFGEGVSKVKDILIIFGLIGCLTGVWRLGGVIPIIIVQSLKVVDPSVFIACTFLLCSLMSFLTGTSFGTASTMGVICMMVATSAGLSPVMAGGAVVSGIFVGDRCSPMSSSAQLVCTLTGTNIYTNIKNMLRTGLVPFVITVLLYWLLGSSSGLDLNENITGVMAGDFNLNWLCVIPAVLILVLSLFRVDVKISMLLSITCAALCALFIQKCSPMELIATLWRGYRCPDEALAVLMNGGGVLSMVDVGVIVMISSSFSGVFSHTPILKDVKALLSSLKRKNGRFGTIMLTSVFTGAIACNQSLGTILTAQLCEGFYDSREEYALALENTIILIAALIPWSIAGAVPIATVGAPKTALLCAFYLYTLPLWNLIMSWVKAILKKRKA